MKLSRLTGTVLSVAIAAGPATAQVMTAEELLAAIDQRVATLDPYRTVLNDPDPARSLAAMQIMLESGDTTLTRTAIEFGLLSADPKMQRIAAEAILDSGVPLTVALDGSEVEDLSELNSAVKTYHDGAVAPGGIAYVSVPIGAFDPDLGCYVQPGRPSYCAASINGDGIFVTTQHIQARLGYGADGVLSGAAAITAFGPSLAAQLKILE